jgi:hypothetical protein
MTTDLDRPADEVVAQLAHGEASSNDALRPVVATLASIKLLLALPVLLLGACVFAAPFTGPKPGSLVGSALGLLLMAIATGLGYPFLWIRTKGLVALIVVCVSAVPLGIVVSTPVPGMLISFALACLLLPLAELVLTRRLEKVWSVRKCALIFSCGVVFEIAVMGIHTVLAQGRPYRAPSLAFQGSSTELRQSVIVPTLDTPMPNGKNVVWCGTVQLAWNRLQKDILHEPPRIRGAESVVSRLNRARLDESDLPANSYLARAGFAKQGIANSIQAEARQKFKREVAFDPLPPDAVLLYAYLEGRVPFTIPYFDNRSVFPFQDSRGQVSAVTSFGIEERHEYAYHELRRQVHVLYLLRKEHMTRPVTDRQWGTPEEFAIDLCASSMPNQIIVACVPPKTTLSETLEDVQEKISTSKGNRHSFDARDVLLVPNLNWEVRHRFAELEGPDKRLQNAALRDYYVDRAEQTVRFKLDRSGAELASEARVVCKPSAQYFILDHPFLLYIQKRGSQRPFFVMWVDNAELLCKP